MNNIIQTNSEDNLVKGIANVVEAHAIGSMASMFGDVPYSEVGIVEDAAFDGQVAVYQAAQILLNDQQTLQSKKDLLFLILPSCFSIPNNSFKTFFASSSVSKRKQVFKKSSLSKPKDGPLYTLEITYIFPTLR